MYNAMLRVLLKFIIQSVKGELANLTTYTIQSAVAQG